MIPSSSMAAAAEEAAILAAAQAQAKEEAEISSRLPREVLNILGRLDHQQLTIDALQGNISKLTDMVEQIALAVNSSPSPATSPLLVSSPHDHRLPDCSNHASEVFAEMPQPYGFDNLKRQTIFLADGTERSYFALPENYPLQRAIPEPVLDVYDVDTKGCTDKFVDVFASTLKQQPYEEESIECSISNNKIELPSLTDFEIGCEHEKALISESAIMCYLASGLGWTEVNATILFFLVVKCSTGKAKLQWDPGIALFSYRFSWLVSDKNRGETGKALVWLESQLFSALQYQLQTSNKFSVWDPGIVSLMDLMLDKTAMPTRVQISQTPFKLLNFNEQLVDLKHIWSQLMLQCTSWGTIQNAFLQVQYCCFPLYSELVKHLICYTSRFSSTTVCRYTATTLCMRLVLCSGNIAQEGRHEAVLYQVLQNQLPMSKISYIWDPGTKHNGLYVYMIQLVGSSAIHACYLPSALLPPTHIVAYGSSNSKSGELTSRCLIFHLQQINNRTSTISHGITSYAYTMDFINDQLEFIRQRGVNENYKTKSLLISSKILPVIASYVWDPGTVLLLSKSIWLLPVIEEKVMSGLIPEQWSSWCIAMHYCKIFQRCAAISSLFHCHGIPLWLINFQVP